MVKKNAATETTDVAVAENEERGLSPLEQSKFLAIRPNSELAEALTANLGDGEEITENSLTRVKTPAGGSTSWTIDELEGTKTVEAITGALVFYHRGGVLWPSFDPAPGTLPVLRTDDLRTAYRVGEELGDFKEDELAKFELAPGLYDWKALPWNQFGTGKNGRGKRCQEYRTLCILREGDVFPLLIRAKPGSLKTVVPFVQKLPVPHFRAIVELKLSKQANKGGQEFSRIEPRLAGQLSREEGEAIRRLYTDRMAEAVKSVEAGEIGGDDE